MADQRRPPEDSWVFRRGGPAAIFSVEVTGPAEATVLLLVDHRDEPGAPWSPAGSFSALVPSRSAFRVADLKEELRVRCQVDQGSCVPVGLRVLPPVWLPC